MALKDNASLALIPAAYKQSKVYSVLPTNGNGDFDFTRSGNATRVNKGGYIETMGLNIPRLDYPLIDGVVQDCPALLLEPSRANYSIYSEDTSTWTYVEFGSGSAGTITTGKTDMFGGTNAVQVDFPANAENVSVRFGHTTSGISSGSAQTSLYIKLVGSTTPDKIIQLRTGSDAENTTISGDNFVRYTKTHTKASNESFNIKLRPSEGTSSGGFSIIICHPQEEVGNFETSYIPTSGIAETRSADVCNGAGTSAEFNDSEGVLFVEFAALANDLTHRRIAISDGTTNNLVYISFDTASNRILVNANGRILLYTVSDETEFQKAAVYYNATAPKLYVNGFLRETETAMNAISGLNELAFDNGAGGNNFYGKAKQAMIFKTALTDSELEQVTSWTSFNEMAKGQLYTIE